MAVALVINSVTYQYPTKGNKNWGQAATAWAQAVTAGMLQKAGGSFQLAAEVDFGTAFGIKSLYYKSRNTPVATAGIVRLAKADKIEWRNNAADGNNVLEIDGSDKLLYNGTDLVNNAGITGPVTSTNNAIAKWDSVDGSSVADSGVLIDGSNNVDGINDLDVDGETTTDSLVVDGVDIASALVPIGTIIAHYDFNGTFVPDPTYWVPCNGSVQTIGGGPLTTPDLSGRYIVGFGTDGGGDNNTAPWATTPVGNAGNTINIAHTHTMAHTHPVDPPNTTTTTDGSHLHTSGTLFANFDFDTAAGKIYINIDPAGSFTADRIIGSVSDDGSTSSSRGNGLELGGSTATGGSHNHDVNIGSFTSGAASTSTTSSALSSSQSIQPRSIRVRYYMRAT